MLSPAGTNPASQVTWVTIFVLIRCLIFVGPQSLTCFISFFGAQNFAPRFSKISVSLCVLSALYALSPTTQAPQFLYTVYLQTSSFCHTVLLHHKDQRAYTVQRKISLFIMCGTYTYHSALNDKVGRK